MDNLFSLFLSQSYQDAWDDYQRAINRENFARWDYVVLTASNEQQAQGFREQIEERQKAGFLPMKTRFAVIPDPDGKRVGSGGATLNVMKYIVERENNYRLDKKRILVIHSGGDSKRVPQYSALGKLFSPVPHELPNGRPSTLFDEFMIGMSGVPGRMREGMLLLSGDVLLLLNSLQIDFSGKGAAAISFKEDVETGKNHGVFLMGKDGNVAEFLHKQPVEKLLEKGAVNASHCVDIDTGAVIFSTEVLHALYSLISDEHVFSEAKFHQFVNEEVRLSLYGDFLYPLATGSTLEQFYQEKPEGEYSESLREARTVVWNTLRPFRMKLLRLSPAKFIHFGTTREIMNLLSHDIEKYKYFNWTRHVDSSISREDVAAYNSILSGEALCGEDTYLEVSYVHSKATVGSHVVLSYIDIHDETIPDRVVLHGLKQKDGKFVARIYGIGDDPKGKLEDGCSFLDGTLESFLEDNHISKEEVWSTCGDNHTLWNAELYPACDTIREAVAAALNIYELAHGKGDIAVWRAGNRKSLCSGFNDADSSALIAWDRRMQELVCMERLIKAIYEKTDIKEAVKVLQVNHLTDLQKEWLESHVSRLGFSETIRLYYYTGMALRGMEGEHYISKCFETIQKGILKSTLESVKENSCHISMDEHVVNLPLRINWGGGWSDTPPYCNEAGGTVLNAAISLNGELPVQVRLKRLEEKKIVFDSRDMDIHGEFIDLAELQNYGDPFDPFALQKAALLACGIIPMEGNTMDDVLTKLGGGIFMSTEVTGVPKGSGLGTSSILAGACVKALFEFMGITHDDDDLYDHVLCMEQIMSTGGGWQDQIGGLSNGVKYITSRPGMHQKMRVDHIVLSEATKWELEKRFALIYTGQRRLARNLLRDVVGRYIGNVSEAVEALGEIQKLAALMRFELERGDVDAFAELLNQHWEMSKQLDTGSTNTCIDQIFYAIEELIAGKMICGAGGGGFLQVILKKEVSKEELSRKLHMVFQDSGVDVWDCGLLWE